MDGLQPPVSSSGENLFLGQMFGQMFGKIGQICQVLRLFSEKNGLPPRKMSLTPMLVMAALCMTAVSSRLEKIIIHEPYSATKFMYTDLL